MKNKKEAEHSDAVVTEAMKAITDCAKKLVETPKFKEGDCVKCSDGSCGIIVTCDWSDSLNCYQYYIDYIGTLDAGYQSEKDLQPNSITMMDGRNIFEGAKWTHEFECPDGYQFKDENGNIINATKIVLEKKKKEYPKTYEECCKVLSLGEDGRLYTKGYKANLIQNFQKLLICRDAYWKIAGEEMGLGKSWKPQEGVIYCYIAGAPSYIRNIFPFPTAEMRDAFYENFDPDIEFCKEFL